MFHFHFLFFSISKHPMPFYYYHKQNLLLLRMVSHLLLFSNLPPFLAFTKSLQPQTIGLQNSFIKYIHNEEADAYCDKICLFVLFVVVVVDRDLTTSLPKIHYLCLLEQVAIVIVNKQHLSSKLALLYLTFKSRNESHSFASTISKEAN